MPADVVSDADRMPVLEPVLRFLGTRSPQAWIDAALENLSVLLLDHAFLELRAAQQAQALIARYGTGQRCTTMLDPAIRLALLRKLSRLAREELRHFEQVVELLAAREIVFQPLSASRYARELHARIRSDEPHRCIDTLIVAAIIEARSCERFYALLPALEARDPELARFYASLLRSEARHFEDYLALARSAASAPCTDRIEALLARDASLITEPDDALRFHSGPPW